MANIRHYENHLPIHLQKPNIRYRLDAVLKHFIKAIRKGDILTKNGDKYRPGTIRVYKTTLIWVEKYIQKYTIVYLDDINNQWIISFYSFMLSNGLSKSSTGTNISRIKAIMNRAFIEGISNRSGYGLPTFTEISMQVALTIEELKQFYYTDFTTKAKNKVRDIFVMHCFLGMRISDYRRFLKSPLKFIKKYDNYYYVKYISTKTNIISVIPASYIVRKILTRNNFDFSPIFSYQYYNKELKNLMKEGGITEPITYTKMIGGEIKEITKQKYQMISSHTARRTFATVLELMDMPRLQIMKMTGHQTEKSFNSYVRISTLQNAIKSVNHEFFTLKL